MLDQKKTEATIGVIIVTYGSSDVVIDCIASLMACDCPGLKIAVCDNASPDNTLELVRDYASDNAIALAQTDPVGADSAPQVSAAKITIITSLMNLGYAGGVNLGLDYFLNFRDLNLFWVLNPDSVVQPDTAQAYLDAAKEAGEFGLMTGRTLYYGENGMIQSDGGRVNRWTGVCRNLNQGLLQQDVSMPDVRDVNFLSGANFVATRNFVNQVGKMRDDYFLYYEEVDWAMRRGNLPLILCPDAVVLHHGGTAIGSGTTRRRPSGFSNYFNYRNRMVFMRRFRPKAIPVSYAYSVLKIIQLLLKGAGNEAWGAWKGLNLLRPPKEVKNRVDPRVHDLAFPSSFPR